MNGNGLAAPSVLLVIIIALGMACATTTFWTHPTKSDEDFGKDLVHCKEVAAQIVQAMQPAPGVAPYVLNRQIDRCLEDLGWAKEKE